MYSARTPDAPIPVTIVGGCLGSGKTTLVNHLLENAGESRLAVIVNDFGQVPPARPPAASPCVEVRLSSGCICCRATTEFVMRSRRSAVTTPARITSWSRRAAPVI
jgi:G3E family GTPase